MTKIAAVFFVYGALVTMSVAYEETAVPNIILILADDQGWTGSSVQMHPDVPASKSDLYKTSVQT